METGDIDIVHTSPSLLECLPWDIDALIVNQAVLEKVWNLALKCQKDDAALASTALMWFQWTPVMYYLDKKKKEPSLWCIIWYRRICSLISPRCIDAWSRGSRKSRSLAVSQLNQAPWFLDITRFWLYASTGINRHFFLSRVVEEKD